MSTAGSCVRCVCCGGPTSKHWNLGGDQPCDDCAVAGCMRKHDGEREMVRGMQCPVVVAVARVGSDVVMCLYCALPLHKSEPLTFVSNAAPGLGGCHARCVEAYHKAKAIRDEESQAASRCPGRSHRRHILSVCAGSCCTACGGPIDENSECRCG